VFAPRRYVACNYFDSIDLIYEINPKPLISFERAAHLLAKADARPKSAAADKGTLPSSALHFLIISLVIIHAKSLTPHSFSSFKLNYYSC
jgi:hypothetical protein